MKKDYCDGTFVGYMDDEIVMRSNVSNVIVEFARPVHYMALMAEYTNRQDYICGLELVITTDRYYGDQFNEGMVLATLNIKNRAFPQIVRLCGYSLQDCIRQVILLDEELGKSIQQGDVVRLIVMAYAPIPDMRPDEQSKAFYVESMELLEHRRNDYNHHYEWIFDNETEKIEK